MSGLVVERFISNGTDILKSVIPLFGEPDVATLPWHAQLVPTLLFQEEKKQRGEIWRALIVVDRPKDSNEGGLWDDFCVTDVDPASYAGIPLNEFVFWRDAEGRVTDVELSAFRVTLRREVDTRASTERNALLLRLQD